MDPMHFHVRRTEGQETLMMATGVSLRKIVRGVPVRAILVLATLTFWWFLLAFRVSMKNPDAQENVPIATHIPLTQLGALRSSHALTSRDQHEQEQVLQDNLGQEELKLPEAEQAQGLEINHIFTSHQEEELPEEEDEGLEISYILTAHQEKELAAVAEEEEGLQIRYTPTSHQEEEEEEEEEEEGLEISYTNQEEEEEEEGLQSSRTLTSQQEEEPEEEHKQSLQSSHVVTFPKDPPPEQEQEQEQEEEEILSVWSKTLIGGKGIIDPTIDPCTGRYIYMHDLPPEFNQDIIDDCQNLCSWMDMCQYTVNGGLGQPLAEDPLGVFSPNGTWFATEMFMLDVIFHSRMKQYKCLTKDSRQANLVYVPFYAGLDITRYLWGHSIAQRDNLTLALKDWLLATPEWERMGGQDHFLVASRITWDFRHTGDDANWGNHLLVLPALSNVSVLLVEVSLSQTHDYSIPYPTYFHPKQDSDIINWQNRVRTLNRTSLFSFAGAPRPGMSGSIRGQIIEQCSQSPYCKLLDCQGSMKCFAPYNIMGLFMESVFCLQPSGDSLTRRSTFDSIVAGCIPVFFHKESAYTQYTWHLPENHSSYSIFISEDEIRSSNISIEAILQKIPTEQVQTMREEVIKLIPSLLYAHPENQLHSLKDAFDLTIEALIKKVEDVRTVSIVKEANDTPQEDQRFNNTINIYSHPDSSLITHTENASKGSQDGANLANNLPRSHRKLVNQL